MTIFDLLFVVLFLTSCVTFITSAVLWMRGNRPRAVRIQKTYGICFLIYMGIVAVVAIATPQRIVHVGEARCFDDWCITVKGTTGEAPNYTVTFELSSRAKRISQREKGVQAYLMDAQGRRFDPAPDASASPFDVLLGPGQSVETSRSFTLPGGVRDVGVVVAHEGSFCFPGCFIIGEDGNPLHKPAIVPLRPFQ